MSLSHTHTLSFFLILSYSLVSINNFLKKEETLYFGIVIWLFENMPNPTIISKSHGMQKYLQRLQMVGRWNTAEPF